MDAGTPLLFDLDGTLTDNHAGISACIRHALACVGVPQPDDASLALCAGPPLRETFARLLATADPARIEAALAHYRVRYADVGWRENVAYEGIADALAALAAAGARMFVCTSKPQVYAARIVAHFGFERHFERVYGPGLDGALDDKRKLLAHLLAEEALDPARCTLIGDRHHDIRAARANGVRAVGVLWGFGSREELAGADAWVDAPAALGRVLRA